MKKPNRIVILTYDDYWFAILADVVKYLKRDIQESNSLEKIAQEHPHARIWRTQRIMINLSLVGSIFQNIIHGATEINFEQGD